MKKFFNKISSVLLIFIFVVSVIPMTRIIVNAKEMIKEGVCGFDGDNVTWVLYEDGELVISGNGKMVDYSGSSNGNRPPYWNTKIERIIIAKGVTSIGDYAFAELGNLKEVIIPNTVTTIGTNSFSNCGKLESVTIPNSVTIIKYRAFYACDKLSHIINSNNLTVLEDEVFAYTAYYNDSLNWENSVIYIGNCLIEAKTNLSGTYSVKEGTTIIANQAFYGCNKLENIIIPDSVDSIGYNAFLGVNFITVDDNNTEYSSDEYGVLFNKDKTILIQYPTENLRTSYSVPDSVIRISDEAFYYCGYLNEIELSKSLKTIGDSAFNFCRNLTEIMLPYGLEVINRGAFAGCSKIVQIDLPKTLISIGETAFGACSSLTGIVIPQNITTIKSGTFSYCSNLSNIELHEGIKTIEVDAFKNVAYEYDESGVLYVDKYCVGTKNKYSPKGSYEIKDGTIGIANEVFLNNQDLQEIIIPNSLKFIGDRSFMWCWSLRNVSFGQNVETIGYEAFIGNTNMNGFDIPDSVIYIGDAAFRNCENFSTSSIGKNVTVIGNETFFGCNFTEVTIPDGVTSIGKDAFNCCVGLKKITMPNSINEILHFAFENTCLTDVYFNGYEREWNDITISSANETLFNANMHFLHEHIYIKSITESACTEQGYTTYTCECGDTYVADYVDEKGHSHTSEITTPATHTSTGIMTFTCHCGDTYTETIDKIATHNHISVVTEPTCTEQGYTTYTCECGESYTRDHISSLGHDIIIDEAVEATCTATGLTEGLHCSRCDDVTVKQEVIPALNHEDTLVQVEAKAPTCTEIGWDAYEYCTACEYTTYVEKANLGHDIVIDKSVESTCTETGLTEGQHCSRCDGATVEQETIPIKAHNHIVKYDSAKHWKECVCGSEMEIQNHTFDGNSLCECGYKRVVNATVIIKNNTGSRTISYGETLKLSAIATDKPADATIAWYVDGVKMGEGETFNVSFESGTKTVEVKLVDAKDNVLKNTNGNEIKDSENVTVKGGFFQKIISFFKNLFGINRTVVQAIFKGTF